MEWVVTMQGNQWYQILKRYMAAAARPPVGVVIVIVYRLTYTVTVKKNGRDFTVHGAQDSDGLHIRRLQSFCT